MGKTSRTVRGSVRQAGSPKTRERGFGGVEPPVAPPLAPLRRKPYCRGVALLNARAVAVRCRVNH
eukprot:4353488-Heterocapsa_arctica.AAC.1